MPWTPQQFSSRHNHALHGERADHATRIANAVLKSGVPEGESIAIANKWALRHPQHRDSGGNVSGSTSGGIGGMSPSTMGMNPMQSNIYQQYSTMPVEKLEELNAQLGGTPYGQIIRQVLQQKLSQPNAQPENQPTMPTAQSMGMQVGQPQQQPQQQARGGRTHLDMGGSPLGVPMSMASPWWERQEAYGADRGGGFLAGNTGGRQDKIETTAPGGAYVVPADVIAGLGEGNSVAGARVMQEGMRTGPRGTDMPRGERGRGPPRAPRPQNPGYGNAGYGGMYARGGAPKGGPETPVALSHGEFVITPAQVTQIGEGNYARGRRILDHWVQLEREKHIEDLKNLEPPVGAKKA